MHFVCLADAIMANIARLAKSSNDWTLNELLAYNVVVRCQNDLEFFGHSDVSNLSHMDPLLLSSSADSEGLSDPTHRALQYLHLATTTSNGQEAAIDDFTKEILRIVGYEVCGTLLQSRFTIPLTISGETSKLAQPDICLVQGSSTVLLVVRINTPSVTARDPEAQVIGDAIAAFQHNNRNRVRLGPEKLDEMVIPCITMMGTRPIFYMVPVSKDLSNSVITGQYPQHSTSITKYILVTGSRRLSEGMEVPDFRKLALQRLDTFKVLVHVLCINYHNACMLLYFFLRLGLGQESISEVSTLGRIHRKIIREKPLRY
jgi:hypothetical protein